MVSVAPGTEVDKSLPRFSQPMTALAGLSFGQLSVTYHVLNPFSAPCSDLQVIQRGGVAPVINPPRRILRLRNGL